MTTPLSPSPAGFAPSWTRFFLTGSDDEDAPGAPRRLKSGSATRRVGEGRGDRVGTMLGDLELLHPLGNGGMGEVYEALYRADRERYAVKILAREYRDNPTMIKRFEHEFWALRRCGHPGIVRALFSGEVDGDRFYVMELLRGESLEHVLGRGRLAPERVARIGVQLSEALFALHTVGVLHRDLKPANILLLDEPGAHGGEQVRLIDLGIAKLLPRFYRDAELRTPPEKRLMTQVGARLGTPGYVAPEIHRGAAASEAQDVFSLGVTLFRLATGRMPYSEVLPVEMGDEPRSAEELGRPIPRALETVLRRAFATDPKIRQPSMERLRDELAGVAEELAEERTQVHPAPVEGQAEEHREAVQPAPAEEQAEAGPSVAPASVTGAPAGDVVQTQPRHGFFWSDRRFWTGLGLGVGIVGLVLLAREHAGAEGWMPAHAGALRATMSSPTRAPLADESIAPASAGVPPPEIDPKAVGLNSLAARSRSPEADASNNADEPEGSEEAKSELPGPPSTSTPTPRPTPKTLAKRWVRSHGADIQRCLGSLRGPEAVAVTLHIDDAGGVEEVTSSTEMPSLVRRCLRESFAGLDLGRDRGERTVRLTLSRGSAPR